MPLKYRYPAINDSFKNKTDFTFIIPSEQKHILYNRVNLAFHTSSNLDQFVQQLQEYGVRLTEKNTDGSRELVYSLKGLSNPEAIEGHELSQNLSYFSIQNNFDKQIKVLTDTQVEQIKLINERNYIPMFGITIPPQEPEPKDFEFEKMINKGKKKIIRDRGSDFER